MNKNFYSLFYLEYMAKNLLKNRWKYWQFISI